MSGSTTPITPTTPATPASLSWTTIPPPVKRPYSPSKALDDLPGLSHALHLFLASHMVESEEYCLQNDPEKERLYYATGFGLIQCVKALMSFEDEDLTAAIDHVKHGCVIASAHRKRTASLTTRIVGLVVTSLNTSGVGFIKTMTPVERHAELVYAEGLYEKAIVGIAYSGDWLAFIKEALNMRTAFNIYRQLWKFIEASDLEAQARGLPEDPTIDAHFRTGVYLGVGSANLMLSLMPSKLLSLIELFGYKGDRHFGLQLLYRAGGWTSESSEPSISSDREGLRRTICDMTLLIFHLVLSSFTFDGVDIGMAQKILDYNLKRYPNGVFFLFGQGRLYLCRSQPGQAIEYYKKAMEVQNQYRNLHHISYWEMAIAYLALWDVSASLECWKHLEAEATWSKATYTYGEAACLLQLGGDKNIEEAARLMSKVPGLRQRIAGKSIPLEKFIARKSRKFQEQGKRLVLPTLEFGYFFNCIGRAPRDVIIHKMLPAIEETLINIKAHEGNPAGYAGGSNTFWDDICLAKFLEGICLRYVAHPDPDAVIPEGEKLDISQSDAESRSKAAFEFIFQHGTQIELDHYIVYYAHFEMGRLLACSGDKEQARSHLDLVFSGKALDVNAAARKGKYSMENALHVRTHAALEALDRGGRL
ncbi:Inclusion body clearance protein IML2 [Abortiporus biennis]